MLNESRPLFLAVDGTAIASDNRIRIRGRSSMTLIPDFYMVDIYNISDRDASTLRSAKRMTASDEQNSIICAGEIEDVYEHEEQSNMVLTVSVSDGQSFWEATADIAFSGGAWVQDVVRSVSKDIAVGSLLCTDVRLPRGQTFSGRVANIIADAARTMDARAYITNGTLYMIGKRDNPNILAVSDSDVIGTPQRMDGAMMLKTHRKGYSVGSEVSYHGSRYRVIARALSLDNLSGDWSAEMTLISEGDFQEAETGGGW